MRQQLQVKFLFAKSQTSKIKGIYRDVLTI